MGKHRKVEPEYPSKNVVPRPETVKPKVDTPSPNRTYESPRSN